MTLSWISRPLQFKYPFGVSSGSRTHTPAVFTRVECEGFTGYGEAALPPYLGETEQDTAAFLCRARQVLAGYREPFSLEEIMRSVDILAQGSNAAKAAVDIALHDLAGKMLNKSCCEMMGWEKSGPRETSFTIGLGDEKLLEKKIKEAEEFAVLKIKLGSGDDRKTIAAIRRFTDKPLYVDVNRGWNDVSFAIEMIDWLHEQNVLLVEQPMPVECLNEMRLLKAKSRLPLIADESVKRLGDIEEAAGCFHGINIKLMKSTGLQEAARMIRHARTLGLKIYLGCMGESSCATAAMTQLLAFADYADLDAPLLLEHDPFGGVQYREGKIIPCSSAGCGATLLHDIFA